MSDQFIYQHIGNHMLVACLNKSILTQINIQTGDFEAQTELAASEMPHICELLKYYPDDCLYIDHLVLARGRTREYWKGVLYAAADNHHTDPIMKPVRETIYRIKAKMVDFDITITPNQGISYRLIPKNMVADRRIA